MIKTKLKEKISPDPSRKYHSNTTLT